MIQWVQRAFPATLWHWGSDQLLLRSPVSTHKKSLLICIFIFIGILTCLYTFVTLMTGNPECLAVKNAVKVQNKRFMSSDYNLQALKRKVEVRSSVSFSYFPFIVNFTYSSLHTF